MPANHHQNREDDQRPCKPVKVRVLQSCAGDSRHCAEETLTGSPFRRTLNGHKVKGYYKGPYNREGKDEQCDLVLEEGFDLSHVNESKR